MERKENPKLRRDFLTRREYYRLLAEVRVLGGWVRELLLRNHGDTNDPIADQETEGAEKDRLELEQLFEQAVAETYAKMLEQIEDMSPSFAAELDDRELNEIP